jgi:hypothetical protein
MDTKPSPRDAEPPMNVVHVGRHFILTARWGNALSQVPVALGCGLVNALRFDEKGEQL